MASILRSSKFVRYIAGFARNVVINTPREFDGNFVNTTQCLCGAIPRSFATQATVQHEQNLDRSLRKLDNDVKRSGRLSRRDIEEVLEELRQTRSATSSQSLLVIRCCGNLVPEELPETRTLLVQEIWNTLRNLNVPMDVSHYNALLRVYLENEHHFSPTEFLSEMESIGIEPNRVTYQRLIARYCQDGDIEGATKILEFMREKQLPVNENVFNALINGHSKAGDMDSALGILSVMSQAGLEPSADTYTTLLCGYAAKGDIEQVKQLLATCETKDVYLLDKDLLDVIYALIVNNHSEHVPEILTRTHKAFGYIQDAINTILRLINKGHIEASWTILESLPRAIKADGSIPPIGGFFIKQMVRANFPVEKIQEVCAKLDELQLYANGICLAAETSLQLGNETLAYTFLEMLQAGGTKIRQHFFWPLIVSKAKDQTGNEIVKVLQEMGKFGITPSSETIRDYVIPNMKGNCTDIIGKLREANISVGSAAASLVYTLLSNNDMDEAAIISSRIPAFYPPDLLKKCLTNSFVKTNNLESYITILRTIHDNLDKQTRVTDEESRPNNTPIDIISKYLLDMTYSSRNFASLAPRVLQAYVDQGFTITATCAEAIQDRLGEKLTPEVSQLLARLSSGELQLVVVDRKPPSYTPSSQMNMEQLERLIANLSGKGQETNGLKRQLLTLYYRAREVEKAEKLIAGFGEGEFEYSTGVYAQLADLYAQHDNLDKTVEYLDKLRILDPKFLLDDFKILRIAHVLMQNDRFDTALEMLDKPKNVRTTEEKSFSYNSMCWRMLNAIAEQGKVEELNKVFNILVKNEFIEVNNVLLGPLIKVHIIRDELDLAMEKFEWCCNQFKATPWKNDLACKLIAAEDADRLQKLTDLSTAVHGEINSLYDLVFAFVECGRVRQARKILETPGLQSRPQKINNVCQRYQEEGQVKSLEGLIDATKDLNHIDRSDIYYQLLLSYIKQTDVEKANGLWLQMQEEDMVPTDQFLITLGRFLKSNNLEVPFQIPKITAANKPAESRPPRPTNPTPTPINTRTDLQLFRDALRQGNIETALNLHDTTTVPLHPTDVSVLVERLCQGDRVNEAAQLVLQMLNAGTMPIARVFRYVLNKLAAVGEVAVIEEIGGKLDGEMKKTVSFDNRICHANLKAGKSEEYLDGLLAEIEAVTDEDKESLTHLGEKFPRGGALGILEQHPELLPKYVILATKYAKRGLVAPVNVLWSHYFTSGEFDAADKVWREYLQDTPRIMFQRVVQHARDNKDIELTRKLIEHLKISKVTEGALGNAYSCLLDVLVAKNNMDEVVETFEKAIQEVPLHFINRTAVIRVKEVYDKLEKPFTHQIPAKANGKPSSSSSSSSEEEARKK